MLWRTCFFLLVVTSYAGGNNNFDFSFRPELPPIFGTDFLGWGFDATFRDPFYGLRPQLFKFSFKDPVKGKTKTYRYPTDLDDYSVPDQVWVRTMAKTDTYTYNFMSTEQEKQTLAARFNIKLSLKQINASVQARFDTVADSNSNQSIVTNFVETSLYQLYLGRRIFREDFLEQMNSFTSTYKLNAEAYDLFLTRYGTHFVDSVVVGGLITQTTRIEAESEQERLALVASLTAHYNSAAGKQPSNSSATEISGSLNITYDELQEKLAREVSSTADIFGGDAQFTDFVLTAGDPQATRELFESWKETLLINPVGIRYRLVEIWQLFEDPLQRKEMCAAMATKLGFLPLEDPNYCNEAGTLLGGTVQGSLYRGT